ncbi:MAG TPA: PIG-L family deacetylase, partial [Oleiagrimonas sp.]|nr:PIG-L family deacetylase [Oleiagrimonas sp.]
MHEAEPAPSAPTDIEWAGKSVLAVTPHPDDESLALGGLIQHALRHGASVTLLQITDGDNNPWPQRWLERRWRIGPEARARWGQRRVGEAQQAMQCLGLPAASLHRLRWPDLGVCARLRDDGTGAIEAFAAVMRHTQPDIVVLPALEDRHPDHGGAHVLARLAMARLSREPDCLAYLVHGSGAPAGDPFVLSLDTVMQQTKRQAVLAHHTQVALARRRLLAMVTPEERLYRLPATTSARPSAVLSLPWHPSRYLHPWLQLTVAHADGV